MRRCSAPLALLLSSTLALVSCGHVGGPPAAEPGPSAIRRTIVGRTPAHEPGWETRLYLIDYPPGASAPPHAHPVVGVGWVVEGEFESAFGDEPATRVHAGEPFTDPANVVHRVFRNPSSEHRLRFLIAYTIRIEQENLVPLGT